MYVKAQPEWLRPQTAGLDLERWYQEVMEAGDCSPLCPPPLPAKGHTRWPLQVNSAGLDPLTPYCTPLKMFMAIKRPDF